MRREALLCGVRTRASRHAAGTALGATAAAAVAVTLMIAGCSPTPVPAETTAAGSTATTPSASAASTAPAVPALVPDGDAASNLPYFRQIVRTVWASPDNVRGLAYIDALSAGGFDRATMQVTADTTTVGQAAESIQFSVAWQGACLVGQVGPATGDPVVAVLPLLADGRCLVGQTASTGG